MAKLVIRTATKQDDEPDIIRVAKMSPFTRDCSSPSYLQQSIYNEGFMAVAEIVSGTRKRVVGFVLFRHLKMKGRNYTSLYDVGVDPKFRGKGIGLALVRYVMRTSPHGRIQLVVDKRNEDAYRWYTQRLGFTLMEEFATRSGRANWRLAVMVEQLEEATGKVCRYKPGLLVPPPYVEPPVFTAASVKTGTSKAARKAAERAK